jgi:fibronectin-binding autotransporter adhesin
MLKYLMKNKNGRFSFCIYLFILTSLQTYAQCPADPSTTCTSTISATSAANITVASGQVVCITGGNQTGTVTVQSGGLLIVSGGVVSNQVAVQSAGNLVVSGGTLSNSASLPAGANMFVKNTPTLNGTISMSGGTLNVLSGGTFSQDVAASAASIINNCGTISGTRNFNSSVTLNNYSTSSITLGSNSNILNNHANSVSITYNSPGSPGAFTNYGTGLTFAITSSWNTGFTINNQAGSSITMTAPSANIPNGTIFNNSGTFNENTAIGGGTFAVNNTLSGVFNFSSNGSSISPTINNSGTMKATGNVYLGGGTTNNNGTMTYSAELRVDGGTLNLNTNSTTTINTLYKNNGSITMGDHSLLNIVQNITTFNSTSIAATGCATIIASTTASNVNGTLLGDSRLNFCGSAPTQAGGTINTITAVANNGSGAYRITMGSGPLTNEYIEISGVTGVTNLNGYWQVTKISATTYDLIGSTYTAGAVFGSSQVQVNQSNLKLGTGSYLGYSGCSNPCAPLPIKLVSFTAYKEDDNVKLVWQTIEEKNNQYYVIEKSTDGIHYQTVSMIDGNTNSTSLLTYTEYDFKPLTGISYYRLKQVDFDGSYSYSSIVAVNFEGNLNWTILPNPSIDGNFTILSSFSESQIIALSIIDVTGNRVKYYSSADYAQEMKVSGLAGGLYIVSIQTVTAVYSKKLIVQ